MKQCSLCNIQKPIEQFSVKRGKPTPRCKECNNKYFYKWYNENKDKHKATIASNRTKNRKKLHEFLLDYLNKHSCVDCGNSNVLVLEFDHVRGKKKNVSMLLNYGCTVDRMKQELELCDVRCANCHRIKTLSGTKNYRYTE